MRDTSLRVPPGRQGTIVVQVFNREGIQSDKRAQQIIDDEIERSVWTATSCASSRRDAFDRRRRPISCVGSPNGVRSVTGLRNREDRVRPVEVPLVDIRPRRQLTARSSSRAIKNSPKTRKPTSLDKKRQEADAGRRTARRRAEDGQGLSSRQAPPAARRQDGRPPRQQGRGLQDPAGPEDMPFMADGTPVVDIVLNLPACPA